MTLNERQHAGSALSAVSVLLILFAASGCSALIYEVIWYQLLQFVIGATAVSMTVCLPPSWQDYAWGASCCLDSSWRISITLCVCTRPLN